MSSKIGKRMPIDSQWAKMLIVTVIEPKNIID